MRRPGRQDTGCTVSRRPSVARRIHEVRSASTTPLCEGTARFAAEYAFAAGALVALAVVVFRQRRQLGSTPVALTAMALALAYLIARSVRLAEYAVHFAVAAWGVWLGAAWPRLRLHSIPRGSTF